MCGVYRVLRVVKRGSAQDSSQGDGALRPAHPCSDKEVSERTLRRFLNAPVFRALKKHRMALRTHAVQMTAN